MGWHPVLYARLGTCPCVRQANADTGKARAMIWILSILLGIETLMLAFVVFMLVVTYDDMVRKDYD
jgi:hypothetical protein